MSDLSYSRINWADSPSTDTPINANNLNKMDEAISNIVQKTNQQSTAISNNATAISNNATAISNKVTYNNASCDITLALSGTTLTITTATSS